MLHAAVNARPFHVAPCWPSKRTWSVELPIAEKELHDPSKDSPFPGATWMTTPGSIVRSSPIDKYPLAELGLILIGESIAAHVVGWVMSAETSVPFPSNGIVRVRTEQSRLVLS